MSPDQLAEAITDCVDAGARVINLSSALVRQSPKGESKLEDSLNHAARRGVLVVAAAGNQGMIDVDDKRYSLRQKCRCLSS
jgi:subtilisin family serine protease